MEGWQIRRIAKTFIIWFNPETFDFIALDRPRKNMKNM